MEKRHPAVGILSIREEIRANQRVRELEAIAEELLAQRVDWLRARQPNFDSGPRGSADIETPADGDSMAHGRSR
jgi:hypothetical protein